MTSPRDSATRLLQMMMVASVVLPAALFAYASWISYRGIQAVADERLVRSLDVMQEQALKVLQTVDRTFAEVNEIARDMSDEDIRVEEPRLHRRLASIVATMPQLHAIMLVGRNGRPLAASAVAPVPDNVNFGDRDYFQVQRDGDPGTYVSDMRSPRLPGIGSDFFDLSQRLESPDGAFNGVIAVAVRPELFRGLLPADRPDAWQFTRWCATTAPCLARFPVPADRGAASEHGEPAAAQRSPKVSAQGLYTLGADIRKSTAFPGGSAFASFRAFRSMRLPA